MKYVFKITITAIIILFAKNIVAAEPNTFYIEAFAGYADSAFGSPDGGTPTAGANFLGKTFDHDLDSGFVPGVKLGWMQSEKLRFDISYQYHDADFDYQTNFVGVFCCSPFSADFQSNVILANAYFSPKRFGKFNPYVGVGIGAAINKLDSIREGDPLLAIVQEDKTTELAYRFSLGSDYSISENWKLNLDLSILNIGDFSSGNNRTFLNGNTQPVGEYEFEDTWIWSTFFGIRYLFQ